MRIFQGASKFSLRAPVIPKPLTAVERINDDSKRAALGSSFRMINVFVVEFMRFFRGPYILHPVDGCRAAFSNVNGVYPDRRIGRTMTRRKFLGRETREKIYRKTP